MKVRFLFLPILATAALVQVGCSRESGSAPDDRASETSVTARAAAPSENPSAASSNGKLRAASVETSAPEAAAATGSDEATSVPRIKVSGRVTFPDGAPAAGTRVTAGRMNYSPTDPSGFSFADPVEATAGADGSYEISVIDKKGERVLLLKAEREKCAAPVTFLFPSPGSVENALSFHRDLVMEPGAPVRGRATDAEGKAVAGARIRVMSEITPSADPTARPMYRDHAVTAEDGSFSLSSLASGEYSLVAESERFAPAMQKIKAPAEDLKVTLSRGASRVAGHVFNFATREAMAGATVTLQLIPEKGQHMLAGPPRQTRTGDLGEFEFKNLGPGKYSAGAIRDKWQIIRENDQMSHGDSIISLKQDETTDGLALYLYPGHTVSGWVRDRQTSAGIAGVEVSISDPDDRKTETDGEGRFSVPNVFPNVHSGAAHQVNLQVKKKGWRVAGTRDGGVQSDSQRVNLSAANLQPSTIVDMTRSVTISGTVKKPGDEPAAGARVTVYTAGDYSNRSEPATADADGRYELEVKPFSTVRTKAVADGYPAAVAPEPVEILDEPVTGIDIVLKPGTSVSGRVVDFEDKPAAGAVVSVSTNFQVGSNSYGDAAGTAQSDSEGRFTIAKVPPAQVYLRAVSKGFAGSDSVSADLSSGAPKSDLKLVLRKSHFIAGRVTGPDGKGLEGAHVYAYGDYDGGNQSGNTDAEGKYRLEGLTDGTLHVNVQHPEHGSESRSEVRVDQETVDFVLGVEIQKAKDKAAKDGKEPGRTFIGHVVDWTTGKAISDFTITGDHAQGAEKDASTPGQFLIRNFRAADRIRLQIEAPGYLPFDTGQLNAGGDGSKTEQTFRLGPGGSIIGRTVDKEGNPVEGVRVILRGLGEEWEASRRDPEQVVKTGPDGRFRAERVTAGLNRISVRPLAPLAEQSVTATVEHGAQTDMGDIALGSGGRITGRLVQSPGDTPLADKRIFLTEQQTMGVGKETRTDAAGAFEFTGLKNVGYSVTASDYSVSTGFQLGENQHKELTLRVGTATVRGRVLRGTQPIRANVSLGQAEGASQNTIAEADGSFEFKGVAPGEWPISANSYRGGGFNNRIRDMVKVPDEGVVEKNLLLPSSRIVGRVEDEEGNPVANANISAQPPSGGGNYDSFIPETVSGTSKADGSFALEGVKAGSHGVTAREGQRIAVAPGVVVPAEGDSAPVVLRLGAGGGTIVSTALNMATGAPVPEAWLILSNQGGRFDHGQTRGSDGVLTVENVPPGVYSAQISSFGFSVNEKQVEVKEGETTRIDDVLYDAGALRWSLADKNGSPLPGVKCRVVPDDPASIETPREGVTSAGDGMCVVRGLFPGTYTGTAAVGGKTLTAKIVITAHQLTEITTKDE